MISSKTKTYTVRLDETANDNIRFIAEKLKTRSISETIRASLAIIKDATDYIDENRHLTIVDPHNENTHIKFKLIN